MRNQPPPHASMIQRETAWIEVRDVDLGEGRGGRSLQRFRVEPLICLGTSTP